LNIIKILGGTGLSLIFLSLVFIPMEKVFPAKKNQKTFRPHWITDLFYFLGQYLLWGFLVIWILSYFSFWLNEIVPSEFRNIIKKQANWIQIIEVVILSDFLIYWGHRLQHKVDFLWRFHKVHHSSDHLDWLAAHREHPLDSIYTIGIINLPAFIMGFSLEALTGLIAFRGIWAIYIHSNVKLPLGILGKIIGSPELHHWHHDLERDRGNYANISPMMDIIFGTHTSPKEEPKQFGIKESFPKSYLGQLIHPIFPYKLKSKVKETNNE
jgi:sterol desaturase/sphingolipid hydroxylase (fatty acid hydroxylase superfamily)